jgi:hypothetical protein
MNTANSKTRVTLQPVAGPRATCHTRRHATLGFTILAFPVLIVDPRRVVPLDPLVRPMTTVFKTRFALDNDSKETSGRQIRIDSLRRRTAHPLLSPRFHFNNS